MKNISIRMSIYIHLAGGLGNQLFQYAAAYLQMALTNGIIIATQADNPHDLTDYRNIFGLQKQTSIQPNIIYLFHRTPFETWDPIFASYIYLHGCFQNYSVLKPILPDFSTLLRLTLASQREQMRQKYDVSRFSGFIHVRRGDYIGTKNHVQDLSYYKAALQQNPALKWYIFSDDMPWVKSQTFFQDLDPVYVEETPIMCLALMCELDIAIIANSTFSWWGAYLSGGRVIYPKKWYDNTTPDLFPETWIGI